MGSNMWRNDPYDIRKFKCGDIATFVDIGGNQGLATMTAFGAWYDDQCRYLLIEPFPPTMEKAMSLLGGWAFRMGVEPYNMALGNDETLYFVGGRFHGEYKFLTSKEFQEMEKTYGREAFRTDEDNLETPVQSYRLPALMRKLNVDQTKEYFLKIDCEGGERFIFEDPEAVDIIAKSAQTAMEVHYMGDFTGKTFVEFALEISKTHVVRRTVQANKDGVKGKTTHLIVKPEELERLLAHPNPKWCEKVWKSQTEATFVRKDWKPKRYSNERMFVDMADEMGWSVGAVMTGKEVG